MRGSTVCDTHGGKTGHARAAAARRIAEAEAHRKALKLLAVERDITDVTDPGKVLIELAGEALAFKAILAEHVSQLTEMRYEDRKGAEQIRGELEAYERALDRAEKFVGNLAKLGIADRIAGAVEAGAETTRALTPAELGEASAVLYLQSTAFRDAFDAKLGRVVVDAPAADSVRLIPGKPPRNGHGGAPVDFAP